MASVKICRTFILVWMLPVVVFAQTRPGERTSPERDILSRTVVLPKSEGVTAPQAFASTLSAAGVPGGIAVLQGRVEQAKHKWEPAAGPLGKTLDSIAATDPDYRWILEEGVVNLVPARGVPRLLGLRIARFDVKAGTDPRYAIQQLFDMPEVRKRMSELALTYPRFTSLQGPVRIAKRDVKPTETGTEPQVHCQNVTLQAALNAIVRAHGRAVWAYREVPSGGRNEIHVDLLVQ